MKKDLKAIYIGLELKANILRRHNVFWTQKPKPVDCLERLHEQLFWWMHYSKFLVVLPFGQRLEFFITAPSHFYREIIDSDELMRYIMKFVLSKSNPDFSREYLAGHMGMLHRFYLIPLISIWRQMSDQTMSNMNISTSVHSSHFKSRTASLRLLEHTSKVYFSQCRHIKPLSDKPFVLDYIHFRRGMSDEQTYEWIRLSSLLKWPPTGKKLSPCEKFTNTTTWRKLNGLLIFLIRGYWDRTSSYDDITRKQIFFRNRNVNYL